MWRNLMVRVNRTEHFVSAIGGVKRELTPFFV
jgi:hypothetical protein